MKRNYIVYIKDILESIEKIEEYTKDIDFKEFSKDVKTQDSVIRRLEIIGEAVKNIPDNVRNKYPDIPWKNIAGLRDVLIHSYFGVNLKRTWNVVKKDIPELKENIKNIKAE